MRVGDDIKVVDNLQAYVGSKIIKAEPMTRSQFSIEQCPDKPNSEDEDWPTEGYKVIYPPDNYTSWCPKEIFERCYRRVTSEEKELIL